MRMTLRGYWEGEAWCPNTSFSIEQPRKCTKEMKNRSMREWKAQCWLNSSLLNVLLPRGRHNKKHWQSSWGKSLTLLAVTNYISLFSMWSRHLTSDVKPCNQGGQSPPAPTSQGPPTLSVNQFCINNRLKSGEPVERRTTSTSDNKC